jgi:hypothetical protein
VTSAPVSITKKSFDENMLKLSFPCDEPTVAAQEIIEIRNPITGLPGASNRKPKDNQK